MQAAIPKIFDMTRIICPMVTNIVAANGNRDNTVFENLKTCYQTILKLDPSTADFIASVMYTYAWVTGGSGRTAPTLDIDYSTVYNSVLDKWNSLQNTYITNLNNFINAIKYVPNTFFNKSKSQTFDAQLDFANTLKSTFPNIGEVSTLLRFAGKLAKHQSVFPFTDMVMMGYGPQATPLTTEQLLATLDPDELNLVNRFISNLYVTDQAKYDLIKKYSPLIYWSINDWWPCSVEWLFKFYPTVQRKQYTNNDDPNARWSLQILDNSKIDFRGVPKDVVFHGNPNLAETPLYAFWTQNNPTPFEITVAYYVFCPYNLGKSAIINISGSSPATTPILGNHIGDWEGFQIHLTFNGAEFVPDKLKVGPHSFNWKQDWGSFPKQDTHPILYAAQGSHGLWPTVGENLYLLIDIVNKTAFSTIADTTIAVLPWQTWNNIQAYVFNPITQEKYTLPTHAAFPEYFNLYTADQPNIPADKKFAIGKNVPGLALDNPASGPLYRWGNPDSSDCDYKLNIFNVSLPLSSAIGQCVNVGGPTGPIEKGWWQPDFWTRVESKPPDIKPNPNAIPAVLQGPLGDIAKAAGIVIGGIGGAATTVGQGISDFFTGKLF
ncbi:MAG: hypothetical protein RLZ12_498 [Bacillota bacterium]|jgi:hypothetical protein